MGRYGAYKVMLYQSQSAKLDAVVMHLVNSESSVQ